MGEVFLLALAAAIYPTLLAGVAIMLGRPNPLGQLAGFLVGGMAFSIGVGLLILFGLKGSGAVHTTKQPTSIGIDVVVGLISLGVAYVLLTDRDLPLRERRARRKERQLADADEHVSWTKRALATGSMPLAIAIGMVLNVPGVWYLAALKDIAASGSSTTGSVLLLIAFNVVMFMLVEIPLVAYALEPERSRELVARFNVAARVHGRTIAVVVCICVGVYLLVRGLFTAAS